MGSFKLDSLCALRACSLTIEHNFGGGVAKCHRYNHMTDIPGIFNKYYLYWWMTDITGTFILVDWDKTCRERAVLLD